MPSPRDKGMLTNEGLSGKANPSGRNYLLAIAIDDYEHCPRLYNCVRDTEHLIEILTSRYQFEQGQVRTLFNEEATESGLFDAFHHYLEVITPADNLVVFFSGHGEYEKAIGEGYWLPVDARRGRYEDYIANSRMIKYIRSIPSRHTLVIVDSCFSGTLFASKRVDTPGQRLYEIPSRWLLTAGREEIVSDGAPGDHSPFADNLLYFLEHFNGDGLSIGQLTQQIVTAVAANARQTPRGEPLQDVGHRGGQFVFYRKGAIPQISAKDQESSSLPPPPTRRPAWVPYALGAVAVAAIAIAVTWWPPPPKAAIPLTKWTEEKAETAAQSPAPTSASPLAPEKMPGSEELEALTRTAETAYRRQDWKAATTALEAALALQPGNAALQRRLDEARSELAWQKAVAENSRPAYQRYLQEFPEGSHHAEARERITSIENSPPPAFTFTLRQEGQLRLTVNQGTPPFLITIARAADKKVLMRQELPGKGSYDLDLSTYQNDQSQLLVLRLKDTYQKVRPASAVLAEKEDDKPKE